MDRVSGVRGDPQAGGVISAFDTATRAIAELQSVDQVLQVIVDQVRPLVGARYAALGTFDADGVVERFITSGITAEERASIGPIPRGHGLIGVIVTREPGDSDRRHRDRSAALWLPAPPSRDA